MRRRLRERQEKREDRPISKKLRAVFLRAFRGQHGEKIVYGEGLPWVTETLGRANSHFAPTKRDWGRHHHVEAAVDWCNSILLGLFTVYTTEISLFTVQKD